MIHHIASQVFKAIFDPVINEKHSGFGVMDKQPIPELNPDKVNNISVYL